MVTERNVSVVGSLREVHPKCGVVLMECRSLFVKRSALLVECHNVLVLIAVAIFPERDSAAATW